MWILQMQNFCKFEYIVQLLEKPVLSDVDCDLLDLGRTAFPNSGISLSWALSSSWPSGMSGWSKEPIELKVRLARSVEMYCPVISEFSTKLTLSETLVQHTAVTDKLKSKYHGAPVQWSITKAQFSLVGIIEPDMDQCLL
jgi:hypothetical protein